MPVSLIATQRRLLYSGPSPVVPMIDGVELRAIGEVGYDVLVSLVAAVRGATADRATAGRANAAADGNAAMLAVASSLGYVAVAGRAHWVRTGASR